MPKGPSSDIVHHARMSGHNAIQNETTNRGRIPSKTTYSGTNSGDAGGLSARLGVSVNVAEGYQSPSFALP